MLALAVIGIVFFSVVSAIVQSNAVPILQPAGAVASSERQLIIIATALMAAIVIPVILLTAVIAWRYRATNTKAAYTPNWEHNLTEEFIWWAVPCTIIIALATLTWKSSHDLDPFKPLPSQKAPITIDVVALPWKWLFIYPDEHIATVNTLVFPTGVPINFRVTADAPMNSFWIPQLGGQIYSMSGMVSQLHLVADKDGAYVGSSANFSGPGFSGMTFLTNTVSEPAFDQWVNSTRTSPTALTLDTYAALAKPSMDVPPLYYSSVDDQLFETIVAKFMMPASSTPTRQP